jgi:hypothetical protein
LVFAWPDQALWHDQINVPGPVTEEEWQEQAAHEIAQRIPWPWSDSVWAYQPLPDASPSSQDVRRPCWAVLRTPVQWLEQLCQEAGFDLQGIEPASEAAQRARREALVEGHVADAVPDPHALASAVARRGWASGPDLRTHRPAPWRRWVRQGARLLALPLMCAALMAWVGWQEGQSLVAHWQAEQEPLEQSQRQLQAQIEQHQARQAEQHKQLVQARQRQAQRDHNQRFAQTLQALSATVPPGLQWQHLLLRPRHIELRGLASDTAAIHHWMERWSSIFSPGGSPQVQWQPQAPTVADGRAWPVLGMEVQLSWATKGNGQ